MNLPRPEVLFDAGVIAVRVAEMGGRIAADYAAAATADGGVATLPPILLAITNGSIIFTADLCRRIDMPVQLDTVAVASYVGERSSGEVAFRSEPKMGLTGRRVLLVDDIADTGRTISRLRLHIEERHKPAEVRTCVLLDKPSRRVVDFTADYVGFTIEDLFVVGYGLDYNEHYRNLPYIGYLREGAAPPSPIS